MAYACLQLIPSTRKCRINLLRVSGDRGRIGQPPMRSYRLARKYRTCFTSSTPAHSNDDVDYRRVGGCKLIPAFRAQAGHVYFLLTKKSDSPGIHRTCRIAASAKCPHASFAKGVEQDLTKYASSGVSGAENKQIHHNEMPVNADCVSCITFWPNAMSAFHPKADDSPSSTTS